MWAVSILAAAACSGGPAGVPREPVDTARLTIYHNGTLLTMEDAVPVAQAIAIRGEKIEAVGTDAEILALADDSTSLVDLAGRTLMPGFVDAHTHLLNDARSRNMSLDQAQYQALRNGITTLGTLYVDEGFLRVIRDFADAGFLRVRTGLYLVATDPCGKTLGDWWTEHPPTNTAGEMLRINGVKLFTDGGSCGRVALSFELEPGLGTGDLWFAQDELNALVAEVDAAGYQAAIHAIGDRAVHQSLNAIEAALADRPNDLRHRMEHVSVIAPEDLPRFGELGVIPVLMGEYPSCTPYGPPIPERFGSWEWPWRGLRETNPDLPLAWHSDVPFQSINPFDHLLGFVTRIDLAGRAVCPPFPWLVENTLTVEQALSIMTIQSAYALNRETEVGSLAPGKYADLIVLANDLLSAEPARLAENQVLLTVAGGRVEYCSNGNPDLCPGFANRAPALLPDLRPPVPVRWLVLALFVAVPPVAMFARRRHPRTIHLLGGLAGLIGGLVWVFVLIQQEWLEDSASFLLMMLPAFFFSLAAAGLAAVSPPGRLSGFGLWLSVLGACAIAVAGVLSEWFRLDAVWILFIIGILSHTIGLLLFGIANLRARALPRWNGLPLLIGLFGGPVPFIAGTFLGENSDWPFLMLIGVLGGGWILMALLLLSRSKGYRAGSAPAP
ncbi:MAG TPA: amidohydrolase family protein [Anaerolineales bacterium]|nr:amidohydrolase family protein [Anaerolineales bacterium]